MRRKKQEENQSQHGGSWKIAYADFITTMMAFFLLLWLLSITTTEQKKGISDYFLGVADVIETPKVVDQTHGDESSTAAKPQAAQDQPSDTLTADSGGSEGNLPADGGAGSADNAMGGGAAGGASGNSAIQSHKNHEVQLFKAAEETLLTAVKETPGMREMADHLVVQHEEEGLRIQLIDQDKRPLFNSGSAEMPEHTRQLLRLVAQVVKKVPHNIVISGHTDAIPFSKEGYTNWELSFDRANASRKALLTAGLPAARIQAVIGKESNDPLLVDEPMSPRNRRICITLVRAKEPHAKSK